MELTPLDQFFDQLHGDQRMIALILHEFVLSREDQMKCRLRYNIPFYDTTSWICYINPIKGTAVELCFLTGVNLTDESGLLQARGRKQVAGIMCTDVNSIPLEVIESLLNQAIRVTQKR